MKIDELKAELLSARKNRDTTKVTILSTIVGNLTSNAKMVNGEKVVTDEDVVSYLKKYVKGLEETLSHREDSNLRDELNYVNDFLPQQLSEEQLREIWDKISATNVSEYMKHLKDNFFGQYDGKIASSVAKEKGTTS